MTQSKKFTFGKRQIIMAGLSLMIAFLGVQIFKFGNMVEAAWDVPTFQTKGAPDAPVKILEFVDYNCPYCRSMHPIVEEVLNMRRDVYYMARPVGPLSENSKDLVKLSLAAGLQGYFWDMHDAFLSHRGTIGMDEVRQKAITIGIDADKMFEDANSPAIQKYLDANTAAASALGISYIPALMINKTIYTPSGGQMTTQDLLQAIADASS